MKPDEALILVDVQLDFCPGGALAVPRGDDVVAPLAALLPAAAVVVATRDLHPPDHCSFADRGGLWPVHCVNGTPGAAYHPGLPVDAIDLHIAKGTEREQEAYSGFAGTPELAAELRARGVRRVIVGGLATDYCVLNTVLDALAAGFEAVVLTDAVRAVDVQPGDGEQALARMVEAGATLATTADLS